MLEDPSHSKLTFFIPLLLGVVLEVSQYSPNSQRGKTYCCVQDTIKQRRHDDMSSPTLVSSFGTDAEGTKNDARGRVAQLLRFTCERSRQRVMLSPDSTTPEIQHAII